jgi:hypothetical protein
MEMYGAETLIGRAKANRSGQVASIGAGTVFGGIVALYMGSRGGVEAALIFGPIAFALGYLVGILQWLAIRINTAAPPGIPDEEGYAPLQPDDPVSSAPVTHSYWMEMTSWRMVEAMLFFTGMFFALALMLLVSGHPWPAVVSAVIGLAFVLLGWIVERRHIFQAIADTSGIRGRTLTGRFDFAWVEVKSARIDERNRVPTLWLQTTAGRRRWYLTSAGKTTDPVFRRAVHELQQRGLKIGVNVQVTV